VTGEGDVFLSLATCHRPWRTVCRCDNSEL